MNDHTQSGLSDQVPRAPAPPLLRLYRPFRITHPFQTLRIAHLHMQQTQDNRRSDEKFETICGRADALYGILPAA